LLSFGSQAAAGTSGITARISGWAFRVGLGEINGLYGLQPTADSTN